jgi:hypothetical protein
MLTHVSTNPTLLDLLGSSEHVHSCEEGEMIETEPFTAGLQNSCGTCLFILLKRTTIIQLHLTLLYHLCFSTFLPVSVGYLEPKMVICLSP